MTYYGYKPREIDKTEIDWSALTKTLSDNLMAEKDRREAAKMDLETKQSEQLQKLNEFEQGLNPALNDVAMKAAQDSRQFLLQNHKLMTSGLKSVDDTKIVKQRVMDTWANMNTALKTFNENDKRLSEMDGKGNEATRKVVADQLNLKNKKLYFDPNTGSGYWANVDESGNIDMNTLLPVKAMNTIQHQEFETFDVNAESEKATEKVADITTFITSTQDLTDPRLSGAYKQWIENETKSALSNDQRKASILMDYLGLEYDVDGKPNKRTITYQRVKEYKSDGSMVMEDVTVDIGDVEIKLNKQNGELEPKLSPEQVKLAEAAYKTAIEIKLGRKATKQYVAPIRKSADEAAAENIVGLVERFVTQGDFSALKSALSTAGYIGVEPPDSNGVIRLIDSKGEKKEVETKNKTAKQVGVEISGFLGRQAASLFNKKNIGGNLNTKILTDIDQYGTFVTSTPKVSGKDLELFEAANLEPNERKININGVKAATQTIAQSLGIPTSSITIKNKKILYKNKEIGTVGVTGGAEIKSKLESAINNRRTIAQIMQEDGIDLKAATRVFNNQ
jgi:hypothetical protein